MNSYEKVGLFESIDSDSGCGAEVRTMLNGANKQTYPGEPKLRCTKTIKRPYEKILQELVNWKNISKYSE